METGYEVQTHILQKVEADPAFRERLLADPKGVIEAESGRELPDEAFVFVQEVIATAQQQGLTSADAPLTQDELVQVMGGGTGPSCLYSTTWFGDCEDDS